MAIYDCFQYFNEDHIVDLRLNILNDMSIILLFLSLQKLIRVKVKN